MDRPEQACDGEGGAGSTLPAVRAEARKGGCCVESDAVSVRVRYDGRGDQLPAETADLPGGRAVPVGDGRECECSELANGERKPQMGRQRSYTTGALNVRSQPVERSDLGRGWRGMRR